MSTARAHAFASHEFSVRLASAGAGGSYSTLWRYGVESGNLIMALISFILWVAAKSLA